jgi:hypothetical protein
MWEWDFSMVRPALVLLASLGLAKLLSSLRTRNRLERESQPEAASEPLTPEAQQRLGAIVAGYEDGSLRPPHDVHDGAAWDRYWMAHLKVGGFEAGFNDMMSSDPQLVGLLSGRGARTVLCAGNGMSSEATSLALHGFEVVALDISALPAGWHQRAIQDTGHRVRRIPGFAVRDDGAWTFGSPEPIDPELCPPIHRSADHPNRGGGSVSFVTGDLMDSEVCPGPFDVVIERRTVQLFPEAERPAALERLVARLADHGTFVSHEHKGCWRFGEPRTHFAERWLADRGFALEPRNPESPDAEARLARLAFTSG